MNESRVPRPSAASLALSAASFAVSTSVLESIRELTSQHKQKLERAAFSFKKIGKEVRVRVTDSAASGIASGIVGSRRPMIPLLRRPRDLNQRSCSMGFPSLL